ncbi:MAG: cyclase family protein [Oscillochloris sp.]|nr:cyclase family protein [Oscillochloris sp.]
MRQNTGYRGRILGDWELVAARLLWSVCILSVVVPGFAGCAASEVNPVASTAVAAPHVIDLSHVVRQDVPYLPDEPHTHLQRAADGRLQSLLIGAQTGTFLQLVVGVDAPVQSIEQLSARDLMLPAVVIDARDQAQDQPSFRLSVGDILAWEAENGVIPAGSLVLLVTGWDVRWGSPDAYLYPEAPGRFAAPGFAPEALELLRTERGVAGFGIDGPLLHFEPANGFCLLLLNLTSLEQLPPTGITLLIGALKVQSSRSAPARVLALMP